MDDHTRQALQNKYLEFKNTSTKIGLQEAVEQYKSIGQQDWRFELLCELHLLLINVQHETSEKANKNIRVLKLLNSDTFLKENEGSVRELLLLFDDMEHLEDDSVSCLTYVLVGFIHLSTRFDVLQCLIKDDVIFYFDILGLLDCVHKLDSKFTMRSSGLIYKILEEYPQHIVSIRYRLIEMQMLPDLITRLTALHCDDTVEFLNIVFSGKPTWYLSQPVTSGQYFVKMKNRIIEENLKDSKLNVVAITSAIRALAGMSGYFGIKLNEPEVILCIQLLEQTRNERVVRLLLCLILISADQFLKKQSELAKVLGQLLRSEISELPILISVYFQTDAIQQIEETIRSILSMQVPIRKVIHS